MKNPLISLEGFDYLFDLSKKDLSKDRLNCLLECLYAPSHSSILLEANSDKTQKRIYGKKLAQYLGVLEIAEEIFMKGNMLEIGSGNGDLSKILAKRYNQKVVGIDIDSDQIEKLQTENKLENLSFEQCDLLNSNISGDYSVVISLHCCGNLTDRVLDTAVRNSSNAICVPCCYGKINKIIEVFPKSMELSRREKEIDYLITRVRALEGYVDDKKKSVGNILLELYRRLIDFDRIFYLNENGYDSYFRKITSRKILSDGKKHNAGSLRSAIVGIK